MQLIPLMHFKILSHSIKTLNIMALNRKITDKIKAKAAGDDFLKNKIISLLSRVDEGKQPKRIIEEIIKEIK